MNANQKAQLRLTLLVVAVVSVVVPIFMPTPGFPLNEASEIKVKLSLMIGALAVILYRALVPVAPEPQSSQKTAKKKSKAPRKIGALPSSQAGTALVMAAVVASLAYVNFGAFHGRVYNHFWEQFHYVLGAKYFPELGYDGLYAASIEAQTEKNPEAYGGHIQPLIRDLRTNEMASTNAPDIRKHRQEVKERFSAERWDEFRDDNFHFLFRNTPGYIDTIRRDHGYNPPPSWTFVARLFAWAEIDDSTLAWLANIDMILLITMFVFVFRTYGARLGCLALIVFGLNYAGRYYWVGGAFLREDWLACSVIGVCMLKREKYWAAGALFGWATAIRVFPVLFLFGPGILGLRALIRRERLKWSFQIVGGFALALLFALGVGSLTGRGPAAWNEFADAIVLHKGTWLTNNVGFDNVVIYDKQTMNRELVNFNLPEPWIHVQAKLARIEEERAVPLYAGKALLLLLLAAVCWRLKPADAAAVGGMVATFTLVILTNYYWQMLLLIPLLGSSVFLYGFLVMNLGMLILHLQTPSFEMRYGILSWALLALFATYLLSRLYLWHRQGEIEETDEAEGAAV